MERGYGTNHIHKQDRAGSNNGWAVSAPHDSTSLDEEEGTVKERSHVVGTSYGRRDDDVDGRHSWRDGYSSTGHFSGHKSEPMSAGRVDYGSSEKKQHRPPNSFSRDGHDRREHSAPSSSYPHNTTQDRFRRSEYEQNDYHSNKHRHPHHITSLEEKRSLRDNDIMCNPVLPSPREDWTVSGKEQVRNDRYQGNGLGTTHSRWKGDKSFNRSHRTLKNNAQRRYHETSRHPGEFRRDDRDYRIQGHSNQRHPQNSSSYVRHARDEVTKYRKTVDESRRQYYGPAVEERPSSFTPRVDRYHVDRNHSRVPSAVKNEGPVKDDISPASDAKHEATELAQSPAASLTTYQANSAVAPVVASPTPKPSHPAGASDSNKRPVDDIEKCASPPKKRRRMSMQDLDSCSSMPSFDAMDMDGAKESAGATNSSGEQAISETGASRAKVPPPPKLLQTSKLVIKKELLVETKPQKSIASAKSSAAPVQQQPPQKTTSKLGIPMRWLKPAAKPKKPAAPNKTSGFTQAKASMLGQIPRKNKPISTTGSVINVKAGTTNNATSAIKHVQRPTTPPNRLVTDASEGSSTVSNRELHAPPVLETKLEKIPSAIVTKKSLLADRLQKQDHGSLALPPKSLDVERAATNKNKKFNLKLKMPSSVSPLEDRYVDHKEGEWNSENELESESESELESDFASETDEGETELWAGQVLGQTASRAKPSPTSEGDLSTPERKKFRIRLSLKKLNKTPSVSKDEEDREPFMDEKEREKLEKKKRKEMMRKKASMERSIKRKEFDEEKARKEMEEERRKREEAKPLTEAEIRAILGEDDVVGSNQSNWVRRSSRKPSAALLNSKPVKMLIDKLRYNDPEMKVLKMKKFIADPNAPSEVLDAALNAMEENTNCEALYIQNFNEGMRDQQVLHLLRILQQSSCKIWCLNIGENYNVGDETWEKFTKGLVHTKITHMYASEHTITSEMKDEIRETIRENRKKHSMHSDPNNLDVIIQCTHCWWNPVNAKILRPYLKKKGYEHILNDKEAQGLQGSTSAVPTV
jgi:hypothetical protein